TNTWLIGWWLVLAGIFLATLGEGLRFIATGIALIALIAAIILAGVVPLATRVASGARSQSPTPPPLSALFGGLLLRFAIGYGPPVRPAEAGAPMSAGCAWRTEFRGCPARRCA